MRTVIIAKEPKLSFASTVGWDDANTSTIAVLPAELMFYIMALL
jgi:hypothetical protein